MNRLFDNKIALRLVLAALILVVMGAAGVLLSVSGLHSGSEAAAAKSSSATITQNIKVDASEENAKLLYSCRVEDVNDTAAVAALLETMGIEDVAGKYAATIRADGDTQAMTIELQEPVQKAGKKSLDKNMENCAQQIMALRQRGVTQFLTACDCGVGLYAAEIVNGLRETTDQGLMLFCYTPHEEQATKWAPYLRERYFTMLEKCTHISVVCPVGTPDAQLQAYRKIIDLADVVLCVHDADMSATDSGENRAFAFAVESHTPTLVLHPKELTAEWVGERFYPRRS